MFTSSRLKIKRAESHVGDLKKAFETFVAKNPYTISTQGNAQGGITVNLVLREPLPDEIPLIMGDAIHNLRAAFDHATWELIGLDNGTQDRWTKLPVSATGRTDYESACRGIKTPRQDTKDFFVDLAVYKGGGSPLYTIHELDNMDKHMVLIPMLAAAGISKIVFRASNGAIVMQFDDCTFGIDADGRSSLGGAGPGISCELENDTKITPGIFFAPQQPLARQPVIPSLETLAQEASVILDSFEAFVALRT